MSPDPVMDVLAYAVSRLDAKQITALIKVLKAVQAVGTQPQSTARPVRPGTVSARQANQMHTIATAAEYARCSAQTIRRALRSGRLVGHQPSPAATWRIDPKDLDRWIQGGSKVKRPQA